MSVRFASARERRLWILALVVLAAIYSTLGLARSLADELRNRGLFDALFGLGALLLVAGIVALSVRARPGVAEIGAALAVAAAYVMVFARIGIPEERTHLLEYGVVAALIHEALEERAGPNARWRGPALRAVVITSALGVLDECIQAVLPNRVFDPVDIGFNALAATMAVGAKVILTRAARRGDLVRQAGS